MATRSHLQVPVDPPAQREKKDLIEYFWEYFWEDPDPELEVLKGEAKKSSPRRSKHNHHTKQNLARHRRVKKDSRRLSTVTETSRERAYRVSGASPSNVGESSFVDHTGGGEGGIPEDSSIREAPSFSQRNRSIRSIKTLDTFDFVPGCRGEDTFLSCHNFNQSEYTFSPKRLHSELESQPVLSRTPIMASSRLKGDTDSRLRRMGFVAREQRDDEEDVTLFGRLFGSFIPPPEEEEGAQGGIDETESFSPRQQSFVLSNRSDLVWADYSSDNNPKNRVEKEASRFHNEPFGGGESGERKKIKQKNKLQFGRNSQAETETATDNAADVTSGDRYSQGLPRGFSPWHRIESYQSAGSTSVGIPLNPVKKETIDNNSKEAFGDDYPVQQEQESPGPEPHQLERHDEILRLTLSEFTEDETTVRRRPGLLACRKGNLRELEESSIAETAQMSNTYRRLSCKRRDGNMDDGTSWRDINDGYSNAGHDDSILLLQLEPTKKDDFLDSILVNNMKSKRKTWNIPRKSCGRSGASDSVAESELSQDLGKKCALRPRFQGKYNYDIPTPLSSSIKHKPSVTFAVDDSTVSDTLPDFSHDDAASMRQMSRMNPHFRESPTTPEITKKSTPKQTPIAEEPAQIADRVASVPDKAKRAEKAVAPAPRASVPEMAKKAEKAPKPGPRASTRIHQEIPGRSTRGSMPEKSTMKKSTRAANPGKTESTKRIARQPPQSEHASRNEKTAINNRAARTARDRGGDLGSIAAHSHYDYKARPRLQTPLPPTLPPPRLPKTLPSPRPKSLPKTLPKTGGNHGALPKKTVPPKRSKNIRPRVMGPPKTKERASTRVLVPAVHPFEVESDDDDDEDFTSGNESDDGDDTEDEESYEESQSSLYDRLGAIQHKTKYTAFNIQESSWEEDDYSLDAMTKFSHR